MRIHMTLKSGIQMVVSGPFSKTERISSAVRNASCSNGWLHIVVQTIFGTLTVASFIIIVFMTLPKSPRPMPMPHFRCHLQACRVICEEAPYYGKYIDDVLHTILRAGDDGCIRIQLTLYKPMFLNETLPVNFLSSVRYRLYELNIFGGNLMHIPNEAFMNQYTGSIEKLLLRDLTIKTWTSDSFIGLSSLKEIHVKRCRMFNVEPNALRPVIESLVSLTVTESGEWDPTSVTGLPELKKLSTVDFSNNNFPDVLNKHSFAGLKHCKILYLNSCKISFIGLGTFDSFNELEILYLNNNNLTHILDGLFESMMMLSNPKPRINLQYNPWYCGCSAIDLIKLTAMDMLLSDPYCEFPESFKGKTISQIENCSAHEVTNKVHNLTSNVMPVQSTNISNFIYVINGCYNENRVAETSVLQMYSPVRSHECYSSHSISRSEIETSKVNEDEVLENEWIQLSFLIKTETYSLVRIAASQTDNLGLVWYLSTCPNEVYCVNSVPGSFEVYNADIKAQYTFCPILLVSGAIETNKCVIYQNSTELLLRLGSTSQKFEIYLYFCTGLVCLSFGAVCVYVLIRKYPHLLRGSNRILFVKHKTVDALVLPPKVPIRKELSNEFANNYDRNNIFMVPDPAIPKFDRMKSTRSSKSMAPSYISAFQPTDDQLADWRIKRHFNNDLSITSVMSDIPTNFRFFKVDSVQGAHDLPYKTGIDDDIMYESLK